jgi:hypothetical protein
MLLSPALIANGQVAEEDPCGPSDEIRDLGVISVAEMVAQLPNCPPPSPEDYEMGFALALDALKAGRPLPRDIPPILSDFQPPQGLDFLGSATARLETTAVYESSLSSDAAIERTLSALHSSGWETYRPWTPNGHFNVHMPYPMVCRESRVVYVIPQRFDTGQYILLSSYDVFRSCDGNLSLSEPDQLEQ